MDNEGSIGCIKAVKVRAFYGNLLEENRSVGTCRNIEYFIM